MISHRGNLYGKVLEKENTKAYILAALNSGFDVEVDIWAKGKKLYLGHDQPAELAEEVFFKNNINRLWCHAKNCEALRFLLDEGFNCFWHQEDEFTLTSKGYIWAYPVKYYPANVIAVLPERYGADQFNECAGICSDFIGDYK